MNYYLDTEFLEGPQNRKIFGIESRTPPTIDLISIGIISEDNREYYAVSKDFNLREAWDRFQKEEGKSRNNYGDKQIYKVYWLRENVLKKVFNDLLKIELAEYFSYEDEFAKPPSSDFTYKKLKELVFRYGKTNKEIADEVLWFCRPKSHKARQSGVFVREPVDFPVFYAYYADYDWVVFCWLFGNMMNLPEGFPMYCRDLKQVIDEKAIDLPKELFRKLECSICNHNVLDHLEKTGRAFELDFRLKMLKEKHPEYPKQDNSKAHSAIEDARWNKLFHEFLKSI